MVNYIVYNITTGDILRTGNCPKVMMSAQAINENEAVIEHRKEYMGVVDDVCDVVLHPAGVIIKDFKTSRATIAAEEEVCRIKKEFFDSIETKINEKLREIGIRELREEGKL